MLNKNIIKKKKIPLNKISVLCAVLLMIFIFVDNGLRPLIVEMAKYKVQNIVTQAANQAIIEEMEKTPLSYGDLITVSRDEKGDVSLLSYNALEVNRLKSKITSSVIKKVAEIEKTNIYIPIANILPFDYIHNKGPRLSFTLTPAATIHTDIESSFEYTGINQVNHRIFIVLKIQASALIPNYSTTTEFRTRVCVAQTVIIGKVPDNLGNNSGYFGD